MADRSSTCLDSQFEHYLEQGVSTGGLMLQERQNRTMADHPWSVYGLVGILEAPKSD